MRELSGGKPVGIKLCVGYPHELFAVTKAMLASGILLDFIVIDGAEGGTGAAPQELSDSLGTPLREAYSRTQRARRRWPAGSGQTGGLGQGGLGSGYRHARGPWG